MMKRVSVWLGVFIWLMIAPAQAQDSIVTLTIINTSDEHGWMQQTDNAGGAAFVYSMIQAGSAENLILLSGGDNWTGPAISTWFSGEPMVELFNVMGYDASAIGNHEFDFGREIMQQRFAEADYPYLAANIRYIETGELFAQPYILIERGGVTVGIIGLTTLDTQTSTHPRHISDLEFVDYVTALEEIVPQVRAEGADIIIGLTHVCSYDLGVVARSGLVDVLFTGHCNERVNRTVNDVPILGGGDRWQSYAQLVVTYDTASDEVVSFDASVVEVDDSAQPDADISAIVDRWQAAVDEQLAEPIGYTDVVVEQRSWEQANLITDSWLWIYPSADIAITNFGGMRAPISEGVITWGDIVGVLPFDNVLIAVDLTGAEIIENLRCCGGAISGMTYQNGEFILNDGTQLDMDAVYTVLVNDFMYYGGDDYRFNEQNPDGYNTSIHWRQPVIDYLLWLETSMDDPLSNHLDSTRRLP